MDGVNVVMYLRMPGKPFGGNWTLETYLDQRATQEQIEALGAILSGQAGGMFAALGGLIGTALPPKQVPISFDTANGEYRISVPGLPEVGTERIPNPVPGEPPLDSKATDLAVPFFTGPANIRRSSAFPLTDPNLSFQHPGQSSFSGQFDYSGPQSALAMQTSTPLESVLKRDRVLVLSGVAALAALAWAYMLYLTGDTGSRDMAMPQM